MFGYVNIYKPELKVKDYVKYRAYYCGLCQVLQKKYGLLGKMTLSYDMTFLIVFLTSIYEPKTMQERNRCIVHPIDKRPMMINEITEYAASMNIVLMYYKFVDDWKDEKKPAAMVEIRALHQAFLEVESVYPKKCDRIKRCLNQLAKAEQANERNLDQVSRPFGELMSELFAFREDIWEEDIRKMAFFLGKFIYLMDAYDDFEKDQKEHQYNPLKQLYKECRDKVEFTTKCENVLKLMMADCTNSFEKLPCIENEEILRNILYVGVWNKFDAKNREEKRLNNE